MGTHSPRSHLHGRAAVPSFLCLAAVIPISGLFLNFRPYCWPFKQRKRGLPLRGEAQVPLPKGLEGAHRSPSLTLSHPQGMPGKDGQDGVPGLDGEKVGPAWGSAGRRRVCGAFSLQDPSTCPTNPTGRSWSPRCPGREGAQRATGECMQLPGGHLPRAGVCVGSLHQGQGGCGSPSLSGCSVSDLMC